MQWITWINLAGREESAEVDNEWSSSSTVAFVPVDNSALTALDPASTSGETECRRQLVYSDGHKNIDYNRQGKAVCA
jgi:hypothetical protein